MHVCPLFSPLNQLVCNCDGAADENVNVVPYWTTSGEQSIREDLEWMGWKPVQTTFSSDSFQVLYDMAIKLIEVRPSVLFFLCLVLPYCQEFQGDF